MAKIEIDGVVLAYETFGEGDRAVIISPGGRYSKDTPGIPALAEKVAECGFKVFVWDRPNSGESDISFAAQTESLLYANMLAGLIRALKLGPATKVAPVDKLSVVLVAVFAVAFLGERPTMREWSGIALVAAGVIVLSLRR